MKQEIFSSPEPSQHVKVEVKEEVFSSPETSQPSKLTSSSKCLPRRQGSRNQHAEWKAVSAPPEPEISALFQGKAESPTPHVEDVCLFGDLLDAESTCAGKNDKDSQLDQNLTRRFQRIATTRQQKQQPQQQQYAKHSLDSDVRESPRPWKLAKLRPHSQHNKSPASTTTASPENLDKKSELHHTAREHLGKIGSWPKYNNFSYLLLADRPTTTSCAFPWGWQLHFLCWEDDGSRSRSCDL